MEEEKINSANAIKYLEEGDILSFNVGKKINYVILKRGQIYLASDNYKTPVTKDDFISLFKGVSFKVVEDDEESVDPIKDQEYYSWGREM